MIYGCVYKWPSGQPWSLHFVLSKLHNISIYAWSRHAEMKENIVPVPVLVIYEPIRKACFKGWSQSDGGLTKLLTEKFGMPTQKFTGRKKCYMIGHIWFSDLVPYGTRNWPVSSTKYYQVFYKHIPSWPASMVAIYAICNNYVNFGVWKAGNHWLFMAIFSLALNFYRQTQVKTLCSVSSVPSRIFWTPSSILKQPPSVKIGYFHYAYTMCLNMILKLKSRSAAWPWPHCALPSLLVVLQWKLKLPWPDYAHIVPCLLVALNHSKNWWSWHHPYCMTMCITRPICLS